MPRNDVITGIDLTGDHYTVVQSLIRNRYRAEDGNGNVVLRGKQKMFKMKEEFPFVTGDGEPAFTVKASGILDIAGDYTILDEPEEEPVVVLDHKWTLLVDHWRIRDPETEELLAEITSKNRLIQVLRHVPYVGSLAGLVPHAYEITDADGDHVGTIQGRFSLRDRYDVTIDGDVSDVPKEAIVAAAMVIDAIEGN